MILGGETILKTLDQSLKVLENFTLDNPIWSVRELSRKLNMNPTVIHRILKTFKENQFLQQDKVTKKYKLGFKFLQFSNIVLHNFSLIEEIQPLMQRITDQVKETTFLTWKEQTEGITMGIVESEKKVKLTVSLGTRIPLHIGASCKSILAFSSLQESNHLMNKFHLDSQEKKVLKEKLETIRNQGWSYTEEEYAEKVFGISIPLFNKNREAIASITISGPNYRITDKEKKRMLYILQTEAKSIQQLVSNVF